MAVTLRPLTPEDYPALARFYTEAGQITTAESIRRNDEKREPYCRYGRYLAEADGAVVGTGRYRQNAGVYHPRKFDVKVLVLPAWRGRGIGSALYQSLVQALEPFDPLTLGTAVRENEAAGMRFAEQRGFVEDMRQWESHLDLKTADLSRFGQETARAAAEGYTVTTFAAMAGEPDRNRLVYELLNEVRRDVPSPEPLTDIPRERWEKAQTDPKFWPEGFFIARKGDELVGMSQLWKSDDPAVLNTGLTAVRRAHRGLGVAMALKVQALQAAQAAGYQSVTTFNEVNNQAMLAVNEKLGFVRRPALVHMSLQVKPT